MKRAKLYLKGSDLKCRCIACSWYCELKNGTIGVCGTRYNKGGDVYSLVYGKPIGLQVDPVEKKPLFHFLPGKKLLSFGTLGCNFGCTFCQNYQMSQMNKQGSFRGSVDMIKQLIETESKEYKPSEIVDLALNLGVAGIAYTYNEPTIFIEYAKETMVLAKKAGLKNVFVSNGFESVEAFEYIKDDLDAINIDLKSNQDDFYIKICKARLGPVKKNIKRFFEAKIETEVTTLIIPELNDGVSEMTQIAKFIYKISPDIPWHISAYYPTYLMTKPPTPIKTLIRAYEIGKKTGLNYVYIGNVVDESHSRTRCPQCQAVLINRVGYKAMVKNMDLVRGSCQKCGKKIYGKYS